MIANKPSYPQLQRRPGRRTSNPSPTSPAFQRRLRRPSDSISPDEVSSENLTTSEPKAVDAKSPSPTFDFLAWSSPALEDFTIADNISQPKRTSEEQYGSRRKLSNENSRPATSGSSAPGQGLGVASKESSHQDVGTRSSPLANTYKDGYDTSRFSESRDRPQDVTGANHRNYSTVSFATERSFGDDQYTSRASAGKKSRLNLLNPMSLLARRRSSQNTNKPDDSNLHVNTMHVPAIPDNFEPSIRGHIVHDFSAPRDRRGQNTMSPRPEPFTSPGYPRRPSEGGTPVLPSTSVSSPPVSYSPMFKEHFQEDRNTTQPNQTCYLQNITNTHNNLRAPSVAALPSFAKRLPLRIPEHTAPDQVQAPQPPDSTRSDVPPKPESPPPPPPKRTPSPTWDLPPASSLPKHMTSTSSRFSFQIGGQGSSVQEKLLEEKHKEHASKRPANIKDADERADDDYDDYDFDDGGLEEDIPGLDDDSFDDMPIRNIDVPTSSTKTHVIDEYEGVSAIEEDKEEKEEVPIRDINVPTSQFRDHSNASIVDSQDPSLRGFHFTPESMNFSPTSTQHQSVPTPRDAEGFAIGVADSKDAGQVARRDVGISHSSQEEMFFEGLGISTAQQIPAPMTSSLSPSHETFDDSDLYFDDGEFENEILGDSGTAFDEEAFDDEDGILKNIPAENARRYNEALRRDASRETEGLAYSNQNVPESIIGLDGRPERNASTMEGQVGLTEDNLAAYHDALALAANKAADNGKFARQVSFDKSSEEGDELGLDASQLAISTASSGYGSNLFESNVMEDEGYVFDDGDLDDDLMIAEANAEALENDDEGFYGQEFGFYARAHGKNSADFINGGYFAPRGSNGIKRSHSGKANFQEPNLTPITERSEWSTRNSVASLPIHGGFPGSAHSLPSPGLAQLLDRDSPIVDDEMSLSALMKLRRGAFGGSSTSVNSIGEKQYNTNSSPLAHLSTTNFPPSENLNLSMSSPIPARLSATSLDESEDDYDDGDRPTLTQNTPQKKVPEAAAKLIHDQASSPRVKKGHHSRNSSGSESVSYARDTDGRWVLERRRTGDDGELEIVGREYLAGARI